MSTAVDLRDISPKKIYRWPTDTRKKCSTWLEAERNANQSYNDVPSHTSQNSHHQKNLQTINAGEDVVKREPFCTVGGNVN